MRIVRSCRSVKTRSKTCKIIRRGHALYVIDPKNPRLKCRQGRRSK